MTSAVLSPLLLKSDRPVAIGGRARRVASVGARDRRDLSAQAGDAGAVARRPVRARGGRRVDVLGALVRVGTSVLSAAAFNFFHLPPGGRFTLADDRDWVALLAFVVVAVATGLARRARARARPRGRAASPGGRPVGRDGAAAAGQRRAARMRSRCLASDSRLRSASRSASDLAGANAGRARRSLAFALHERRAARSARCCCRARSPAPSATRIAERVVPSLESILAAALHRAELQAEVVETAALRRSDELKTAVLRSVSHDLRTPLTAILMAATALDAEQPTQRERRRRARAGARRGDAPVAADREAARPVRAAGRAREPRWCGTRSTRCCRRRSSRCSGERGRLQAVRRTGHAAAAGRPRPARAGVRERARERRALLAAISPSRCGRGPCATASACSSSTRARESRTASRSTSSCPSTARSDDLRGPSRIGPRPGDHTRVFSSSTAGASASSRVPGPGHELRGRVPAGRRRSRAPRGAVRSARAGRLMAQRADPRLRRRPADPPGAEPDPARGRL